MQKQIGSNQGEESQMSFISSKSDCQFLEHLDLILCRNVVIYFTTPLQEMGYSNFARVLNKDGF
ncbi:MAG: hypothetical protein HZA27_00785 [Candidatus Omnitrophica bacterium]|nr:hypothetical protein [Candidatus Omnitrophota bacterium]